VKSAARQLQTLTCAPCFKATMRKPSCLTSWSQPGPVGGWATSVGSHGRTKPDGALHGQRAAELRHDTVFLNWL
jgi:hypothetical protein